jgi:hypothetical protein
VEKTAFIIKTRAPRGPRSKISETFVVVAHCADDARDLAILTAHPGAVVVSIEAVVSIARTHIG